jgi:hypothetical protein
MKQYKEVLEGTLEHELFKSDGDNRVACLDKAEKGHFKEQVDIAPVEDEADTLIDECG